VFNAWLVLEHACSDSAHYDFVFVEIIVSFSRFVSAQPLQRREGEMNSESRLQFSPMKKIAQLVLLVVVMAVLAVVILGMVRPTREFTPASAPAHDSYFPALA